MRRLLGAAALLAACAAAGCGGGDFQPMEGWDSDLASARELAKTEGRPLAVLFTAEWSGRSQALLRRTMSDGTVRQGLDGFVRVHVNVEYEKRFDGIIVETVPTLLLFSPEGEERRYTGGDYPADYLGAELKQLSTWGKLEGWLDDAQEAEATASRTGRPLAVLYSTAWDREAVEYEREALAACREMLSERYTLLRLHLNPENERVRSDEVKVSPTLILHDSRGGKIVIPGKQPEELLRSFVTGLPDYAKGLEGWSSDAGLLTGAGGERESPVIVVLDRKADWNSHYLVRHVLAEEQLAAALRGFVKIRLEYPDAAGLAERYKVGVSSLPYMLVFGPGDGAPRTFPYVTKSGLMTPEDIASQLRLAASSAR